jgi:hypothetical protein
MVICPVLAWSRGEMSGPLVVVGAFPQETANSAREAAKGPLILVRINDNSCKNE